MRDPNVLEELWATLTVDYRPRLDQLIDAQDRKFMRESAVRGLAVPSTGMLGFLAACGEAQLSVEDGIAALAADSTIDVRANSLQAEFSHAAAGSRALKREWLEWVASAVLMDAETREALLENFRSAPGVIVPVDWQVVADRIRSKRKGRERQAISEPSQLLDEDLAAFLEDDHINAAPAESDPESTSIVPDTRAANSSPAGPILHDPAAPGAEHQPNDDDNVGSAAVPTRAPRPPRRRVLVAVGSIAAAIVLVVVAAMVVRRSSTSGETGDRSTATSGVGIGQTTATTIPTSSTTRAAAAMVDIRFDDLLNGRGTIAVYRGTWDSPEDRKIVATFFGGDPAQATCKTKGRPIDSETSIGELDRSSDDWIKLWANGHSQYATTVYIKDPAKVLAALPECTS